MSLSRKVRSEFVLFPCASFSFIFFVTIAVVLIAVDRDLGGERSSAEQDLSSVEYEEGEESAIYHLVYTPGLLLKRRISMPTLQFARPAPSAAYLFAAPRSTESRASGRA